MNGSVIIVGNCESPLKRGDFWGPASGSLAGEGLGEVSYPASGCPRLASSAWRGGEKLSLQPGSHTLRYIFSENQIVFKKDLQQLSLGPMKAVAQNHGTGPTALALPGSLLEEKPEALQRP